MQPVVAPGVLYQKIYNHMEFYCMYWINYTCDLCGLDHD